MDAYLQRQICQRIKQARKAAGLTQEDMANLLNVTTRAYQNYERDRVPFRSLGKIAQLTNVQEVWLLHGEQRTESTDRGLLESAATTIDLLRVIADEVVAVRQALLRIEQATTSQTPAQQTDAPLR